MHKKMERARFNLAPTKTELMENLYHKRMNENMKNAFGADYLDTKNNESAHIRNMFKDWDREIYRQELARTGSTNEIANYIHSYGANLKKQVDDVKKNGFDITKHRK